MDMNIKSSPNGEFTLQNDRTKLTIHPDGTVAISSKDPVQLTGDLAAALIEQFGQAKVSVLEVMIALNKKR